MSLAKQDHDTTAHPYIDDTVAAALPDVADDQYTGLLALMAVLGLMAAPHKSVPPCFQLICIGVLFNTLAMTMSIDPARIQEAVDLCFAILQRQSTTLKELQSLVGKLMHVSKCCPPARHFTARILDLLRAAHLVSPIPISDQARLDAAWFAAFLPHFDGVSLIKQETAEMVAQVDVCPSGAGEICAGLGFYALPFPASITELSFSIASLECFNVLIACRLWGPLWAGKHILLYSDNAATVAAANTGAAQDPLIRAAVREIWLIAAIHDIELVIRHRLGASMHTADALSRAHASQLHARKLEVLLADRKEPRFEVDDALLLPPLLI